MRVEFRFDGGLGDLRDKRAEYKVARGEIDGSFDLNFEDYLLAMAVSGVNDDIVKGPLGSTLEFDLGDGCTGQATRLSSGKHGHQIVSADLPLEQRTCRPGRSGACRCRLLVRGDFWPFGHQINILSTSSRSILERLPVAGRAAAGLDRSILRIITSFSLHTRPEPTPTSRIA